MEGAQFMYSCTCTCTSPCTGVHVHGIFILHLRGEKLLRCKRCDHILLKAEINPSSICFKIHQIALHSFPQVRIFEPPKLQPDQPCDMLLSVTNPLNSIVSVPPSELSAELVKNSEDELVSATLPEGNFQLSLNDVHVHCMCKRLC